MKLSIQTGIETEFDLNDRSNTLVSISYERESRLHLVGKTGRIEVMILETRRA